MRWRNSSNRRWVLAASPAFTFVLIIGVVNLLSDLTYEGGASINGPFLARLGAGAAMISIIAGAGEFLGYALRGVFGRVADASGRHWLMTFIGYAVNLLAVPAMALAGNWPAAGALVLAERTGRAMRKPTVEAMLSYSTGKHGRGWVYAVNTALDETGAMLGPLGIALALVLGAGLRKAYALLAISSVLALVALTMARIVFPVPSKLETGGPATAHKGGFTRAYALYTLAGSVFGAGLMSFEFISYHLISTCVVGEGWLGVLLALATASSILASLVLGKLYDRAGIIVVVCGVMIASVFSIPVFFGGFGMVVVGLLLWGVGYATQDTLLKALIASVLPEGRRNLAFGVFYVGYGFGWLVGSVATGLLYGRSRWAVVVFSMGVQLASAPLFVVASRSARRAVPTGGG